MSDEKSDPAAAEEEGLDELGLVINEYVSTVLVVVPTTGYAETTLRYARSALFNVHVGSQAVAANDEELIRGELQDEFQADAKLDASVNMDAYSGVIFCAETGGDELSQHPDALRLAREAAAQDKLIGAWGTSVAVLARAGVIGKIRVTGSPSVKDAVKAASGRYTGTQIQVDGNIVTAFDDAAGFRFGKALAEVVGI